MKQSDTGIFEYLALLLKQSRKVTLATLVGTQGSTPRESGARMLVFPDGKTEGTVGGGILEKRVTDDALAMMKEGVPSRLIHYSLTEESDGGIGAACGGETDIFIEVFREKQKVLICGGGHVGMAVARAAAEAGFAVVIVDDRPDIESRDAAPSAGLLKLRPDDHAVLDEVNTSTAVVIVTRSHGLDYESLRLLLKSPAFYVGMIGSKRKVAAILEKLKDEGVESSIIDRVYTPIGLDIGAESPEEIAVSIVGEIISVGKFLKPSKISMKHTRGE